MTDPDLITALRGAKSNSDKADYLDQILEEAATAIASLREEVSSLHHQVEAVGGPFAIRETLAENASMREELDRLREQTQMPPPRGKMYCHPDDAPIWQGLQSDNASLRERVRVLEDEVRSVGKAYERLVDRGEVVRVNEQSVDKKQGA